jgi:hypothetical protein
MTGRLIRQRHLALAIAVFLLRANRPAHGQEQPAAHDVCQSQGDHVIGHSTGQARRNRLQLDQG